MGRLLDEDIVIDVIYKALRTPLPDYRKDPFHDSMGVAIAMANEIPPAQPELIRCKDCKYYYFADNRIPQEQRYTCYLNGDKWKPDDYCSYAERRTE